MSQLSVKIGFLPSYRFSFSDWCRQMYDQSVAALQSIDGLELVTPADAGDAATPNGAVHTLDEAEAVAGFFARQGVDGLVICPLDFGDERSAAKVAELLGVPVLLYATKEPPARDEPSLARVSDSYCGNLALAASLYRRKITFHWAGLAFPDEPELKEHLDAFTRAVSVVKGLRGARIGQVGLRPAPFESCGFDEHEMITKFGQNLIPAELSQVTAAALALADDDERVAALVDKIRHGVASVTVSDQHMVQAAKLELALVDFWETNRLSAMAMQCWPSIGQAMGISVCAMFGRLTGRGMLTACEADVLGALAMLVNHRAALGETLPHFIDWTIQHREDANCLLAWHCGNAPPCLARDPEQTALRSRRDMRGSEPVPAEDGTAGLYQFEIKPGPVTLCRLAEYDGEWKMLITEGEIEPSGEELAGTWSWVRVADHARLYRTLVEEGFIHHASMIHGSQRPALELACKFLGIRPVIV